MSDDTIELVGKVTATHRSGFFSVECQLGPVQRVLLCKLAGRLVEHRIRITTGDDVTVEISAYDLSRGRIVYRGARPGRREVRA